MPLSAAPCLPFCGGGVRVSLYSEWQVGAIATWLINSGARDADAADNWRRDQYGSHFNRSARTQHHMHRTNAERTYYIH